MKKIILFIMLVIVIQTETLSQSCLPDGVSFSSQTEIDNFQSNYPGCTKIEGDVSIQSYTITNLHGLSSITSIGESLFIQGNKLLRNLDGLENLDSIGGWLLISFGYEGYGNLSLQNIQGLANLDYVEKGITIRQNDSLIDLTGLENIDSANILVRIDSNPKMVSLSGLDNLKHINGDLSIQWNNSLHTLNNLSNLSSINGRFYIAYNESLKSLEGLENIDSESITEMTIWGNDSLSYCEIYSVCDYLSNPDNPNAGIAYNSTGCNSRIEVLEACNVGYSNISDNVEIINIFPNPAKDYVCITYDIKLIINKINILNNQGQSLILLNQVKDKIDISILEQGLYIVEFNTNHGIIRKKLLINK